MQRRVIFHKPRVAKCLGNTAAHKMCICSDLMRHVRTAATATDL